MRAVCWHSKRKISLDQVPDPGIVNPHDAIVKVTSTAICGSDLHIYDGVVPTMKEGDIIGHEFMGEIVETGPAVTNLKKGDRVVVPFTIGCGQCFFCKGDLWALCDNSNPNAAQAEQMFGQSPSGLFGFSHLFGGYPGGQAEFVRVPFADVGPVKVPAELTDDQVLFLSDILPTAYMAAENCQVRPGDTVAVWGCGPVGQLVVQCLYHLGAQTVIAIDDEPARTKLAREKGGAKTITASQHVPEQLKDLTGGRGPDACVDAVGLEAHTKHHQTRYDQSKKQWDLSPHQPHVLRQAIMACRKGGTISVPGAYLGEHNGFPFGTAFAKGLQLRMGQTHVQRYLKPLLAKIQSGELEPSYIITHRLKLDEAPTGYDLFNEKEDGCIKVVLTP